MTQSVAREQRYTKSRRCPMCSGYENHPRGKDLRCYGFLSEDGKWAFCSRIASDVEGPNDTWRHLIRDEGPGAVVAEYDYCDEKGTLVFQVVRFEPKTFRQRHRGPDGQWIWKRPTHYTLFRLDKLVAAPVDEPIYFCEGERDVLTAERLGLIATCNPCGAGKWNLVKDVAVAALRDRDVVIIEDNDEPGRKHAEDVARSLYVHAKSVRIVSLAPSKDLTDFIEAEGDATTLMDIVSSAARWSAPSSATSTATASNGSPASGQRKERSTFGFDPSVFTGLIVIPDETWYQDAPPPRTWLLRDRRDNGEGVLPLGKVGQLIGAGGVSKTMALIQLAISITTGVPWLETFDVAHQGRVCMLLGEEDKEECRRRVYNGARAMRAPMPDANTLVLMPLAGIQCGFIERDENGNPRDTAFLAMLRDYLSREGKWAAVMIDPLARFGGLDVEKDNGTAVRFVQSIETIVPACGGGTALVAHHTNKQARRDGDMSTTSGRGPTGNFDSIRWEAGLKAEKVGTKDPDERKRLGEVVRLDFTKSNYSMKGEHLLLRRDRDHGGALVPLDDTDLEILERVRSESSKRATKDADTQAHKRSHHEKLDEEARKLLGIEPTISKRRLEAQVMKACGVGSKAARAAVERVHPKATDA